MRRSGCCPRRLRGVAGLRRARAGRGGLTGGVRRRYVHGERVGHDQLPGDFQGGGGGGQSGAGAVATVWGNEVGCSLARAVRQVIKYFYYKLRYANEPMPPEFPIEPSMALELLMAANFLDC